MVQNLSDIHVGNANTKQGKQDQIVENLSSDKPEAIKEIEKEIEKEKQEKEAQEQERLQEQANHRFGFPPGRAIRYQTEKGGYEQWVVIAGLPATELQLHLNMAHHLGYNVFQLNQKFADCYDLILQRVGG